MEKEKENEKDIDVTVDELKEEEAKAVNENIEEENTEASEENAEASEEKDENQLLLEEAKKQAADFLDKYQRTLAEFDNFRKRTIKEKASMYDDGVKDTVEKLLPVIDNFERAIEASNEKDSALFKGVDMILKQLKDIFKALQVEEIAAKGERFDPNLHNAVMHTADESFGENEIAEVLQKGYKYKDKVIRPSMVKVAN